MRQHRGAASDSYVTCHRSDRCNHHFGAGEANIGVPRCSATQQRALPSVSANRTKSKRIAHCICARTLRLLPLLVDLFLSLKALSGRLISPLLLTFYKRCLIVTL